MYKITIVCWFDKLPQDLEELPEGGAPVDGGSFCTKMMVEEKEDPSQDPDYNSGVADFFQIPLEEREELFADEEDSAELQND